jgi:hypothetical protein
MCSCLPSPRFLPAGEETAEKLYRPAALRAHLLPGLAALILVTVPAQLSIPAEITGESATHPGVPNIVFILADDKY